MYFCHCPACLSMSVIASSAASSLPSWARQAMQRARTRTVILKYEPRPAAGLTHGLACSHPNNKAGISMALFGSGQACRNPCQQRKSCHFLFAEHHCAGSVSSGDAAAVLRSARNTARRQTATLMLRRQQITTHPNRVVDHVADAVLAVCKGTCKLTGRETLHESLA